ncbi:hypothetical protein ACSVHC_23570 [Arthrobacter sp. KNU-44]|uniref:hypothetical protein n=1 Tax=Arthrobacter sp. KNU-44 TaxID=3450744 RepID=UPI003F41D627
MRILVTWIYQWIRPDKRSLSELADFLRKRKKAASWWDHSHLTRRLATQDDAHEYKELPADKRFVLLQAARFCTRYYSVATLPVLAIGAALTVPMMTKQADAVGIPIDLQASLVAGVAVGLILFGLADIYGASKSAAHAQTWVSAFEDIEKELATAPLTSRSWSKKFRNPRNSR